LFNWT